MAEARGVPVSSDTIRPHMVHYGGQPRAATAGHKPAPTLSREPPHHVNNHQEPAGKKWLRKNNSYLKMAE